MTLPTFTQYVDCYTRRIGLLTRCMQMLWTHTSATPLPALGKADHNLILLQPQYKPKVRRCPTTKHSFRKWSSEAGQAQRDRSDSTDWNVLQGSHCWNIEEIDCTTDYINFCMDVVVPIRTIWCYANNKPWITSDIRALLNKKKRDLKDCD